MFTQKIFPIDLNLFSQFEADKWIKQLENPDSKIQKTACKKLGDIKTSDVALQRKIIDSLCKRLDGKMVEVNVGDAIELVQEGEFVTEVIASLYEALGKLQLTDTDLKKKLRIFC